MNNAVPRVALETTLLLHGVPRSQALTLHRELARIVESTGSRPALIGVIEGRGVVGMTDAEFVSMLNMQSVPKLNTANLGVTISQGRHGATTVSSTMELAASAGIRVFATGGLGGIHRGYDRVLDVSSDLAALTRFPMAVVCSGVKSILDVVSTREALETLGVPVIGYKTDVFPAFYFRQTEPPIGVDARFDDVRALAAYVRLQLAQSGRGIVIANPIDERHELPEAEWDAWLNTATKEAEAGGLIGRAVTPFVLGRLHEVSNGATLRANVELVKSNAELAGKLAAAMRG